MIILKYFSLIYGTGGSTHAEIKGLFSGLSPCLAFHLPKEAVSLAVLITLQQQQTPDQLAAGLPDDSPIYASHVALIVLLLQTHATMQGFCMALETAEQALLPAELPPCPSPS